MREPTRRSGFVSLRTGDLSPSPVDTGWAMSQENVDLVRRWITEWNETGEFVWELFDPQVELVIDPFANLAGTYVGHEGVRRYLDDLMALRPMEARIDVDELVDAGDTVVWIGRYWTRGRYSDAAHSEIAGEIPVGWVIRIRDGRIVYARMYLRPAEALEALGLTE